MPIKRKKRRARRISKRRREALLAARNAEMLVDEDELPLFRFLSEQNAARIAQLCRAFGVYRADMERFLAEFEAKGLIESKAFLTGDDVWVWLSRTGILYAGTGFEYRKPHYRNLAHWGAITDVRLDFERRFEGLKWVCERSLRSERAQLQGYIPDAVAVQRIPAGQELRHAIEVELSPKAPGPLEKKLSIDEKRFDSIIYFASPRVCRRFASLGVADRHPKLRVVRIPDVSRHLDQPAWRIPGDPGPLPAGRNFDYAEVELSDLELDVIDLVAEQGEVPMDQLESFFDFEPGEAEDLVSRLTQARLLGRAKPFVDEPPWLWISFIGAKVSRTGLRGIRPSISNLERRRAANQIRLLLTKEKPGIRWASMRMLERSRRKSGRAPIAAIRSGSQLEAVDIPAYAPHTGRYEDLLARRVEEGYGALIWFYTQRSAWALRAFWEGLPSKYQERLSIRPLPPGDHLPIAPKTTTIKRRGQAKPTLLERLGEKPARLRRMPVEILRSGSLEALAKASPGEPEILEAWVEQDARGIRWVLTSGGFFRIAHVGRYTRVDKIEREGLFIKEEGHLVSPETERRELRRAVGEKYEFDERVWAAVEAVIPQEQRRVPASKYQKGMLCDRVLLSGAIWALRNDVSVKEVPAALGFGGGLLIYRRLRELESAGLLEGIKQVLARELSDGGRLDWRRFDSLRWQGGEARRLEPEMGDRVWTSIDRILDGVEGLSRDGGVTGWISDRAVLSAAIWRLRNRVGWQAVGRSRYCSEGPARARIRKWEEVGVWKNIRSILEGELPDGAELEWWRLEERSVRQAPKAATGHRKLMAGRDRRVSALGEKCSSTYFNHRQQRWLATLKAEPGMKFSRSDYARTIGVGRVIAGRDLSALAEEWLIVGTRGCAREEFTFEVAGDFSARLERFEEP